ncbi:SMP-30/gluconolactonase/LRE family protein [Albimonas sp. CAU 1670]|uniref:SMP-30/gluconolactonase/LRE family protein n=1 Tax=Albimonas sp. CAU 1670 TaxID=3032599 RepID=UPI0023D9798A|nr:SMP-30/gluconolactonase/LRE family protein [Albimonas sp. CAU 1670]MDF2234808.1 SMP-30/gluconolactonase/LRE family protein [Albimonas sp. CAU 1670]
MSGEAEVFCDRPCELGEGPLWHPLRSQLFWFDILGRRLLTRTEAGPQDWSFPEHVSAAGWIDADHLLIATETALRRFHIPSGEHEPIADLDHRDPATRSNDGRADPFGGFWIGTMGKGAEPGRGGIHRFHRGAVETLFPEITIPNAICFSPDGRLAYFADTPTRRILRVALDAEGWPQGEPELFVDLAPEGLNPDGAVVDAEGALWNAQWGAGRVARYLPDGRFDRAVAVGGRHASCPAFGGEGLRTLFVTTAREGIADPDARQGLTYRADAGVAGRLEPPVKV